MKKTYQIPSVIAMQLMPSSIICVSGGTLQNSGSGTGSITLPPGSSEIIGG